MYKKWVSGREFFLAELGREDLSPDYKPESGLKSLLQIGFYRLLQEIYNLVLA